MTAAIRDDLREDQPGGGGCSSWTNSVGGENNAADGCRGADFGDFKDDEDEVGDEEDARAEENPTPETNNIVIVQPRRTISASGVTKVFQAALDTLHLLRNLHMCDKTEPIPVKKNGTDD